MHKTGNREKVILACWGRGKVHFWRREGNFLFSPIHKTQLSKPMFSHPHPFHADPDPAKNPNADPDLGCQSDECGLRPLCNEVLVILTTNIPTFYH
jgi:hypothetical protein